MATFVWIARVILVIALLGVAAAIATPKGRLPLALRGVRTILRRDAGVPAETREEGVPRRRRLAAFALVLLAVVFALA